jgi:hypothetical protein
MKWVVKRLITDCRAVSNADTPRTWYWLHRDGHWAPSVRAAREFTNLHDAERTAAAFAGDAKVEPA